MSKVSGERSGAAGVNDGDLALSFAASASSTTHMLVKFYRAKNGKDPSTSGCTG